MGLGVGHPDRALLRDLRRGRDRRARLLRLDHDRRRGSASRCPAYVYMFGALALMTALRVVPHRADRARSSASRSWPRCSRCWCMCVGDHRQRRRPRRLQRRAAEPRQHLRQRRRDQGLRRRPRPASRSSARSGPGSASRWRPTTPRSRASRTRSPRRATYGSVIGLGVFYIFVSYMFVTGWGLTGSAQAVADQFDGQVRVGVLSADRQVRRLRADDDPADADRHQLVRLRDGLLQHRRALPVRARPRGRAADGARAARTPSATRPVVAAMVVTAIVGVYMLALHDHGPEHRGRAAQARHLDAAARRARHPRRPGHLLGRDHPLLPDRGARRLPLVQDARRADRRRARDGRRVLPADRQPRRALRARATRCSSRPCRTSCSRCSSAGHGARARTALADSREDLRAQVGRFEREAGGDPA